MITSGNSCFSMVLERQPCFICSINALTFNIAADAAPAQDGDAAPAAVEGEAPADGKANP